MGDLCGTVPAGNAAAADDDDDSGGSCDCLFFIHSAQEYRFMLNRSVRVKLTHSMWNHP